MKKLAKITISHSTIEFLDNDIELDAYDVNERLHETGAGWVEGSYESYGPFRQLESAEEYANKIALEFLDRGYQVKLNLEPRSEDQESAESFDDLEAAFSKTD